MDETRLDDTRQATVFAAASLAVATAAVVAVAVVSDIQVPDINSESNTDDMIPGDEGRYPILLPINQRFDLAINGVKRVTGKAQFEHPKGSTIFFSL